MGTYQAKATSSRARIEAIFFAVSPGGKAIRRPMTTPSIFKAIEIGLSIDPAHPLRSFQLH